MCQNTKYLKAIGLSLLRNAISVQFLIYLIKEAQGILDTIRDTELATCGKYLVPTEHLCLPKATSWCLDLHPDEQATVADDHIGVAYFGSYHSSPLRDIGPECSALLKRLPEFGLYFRFRLQGDTSSALR